MAELASFLQGSAAFKSIQRQFSRFIHGERQFDGRGYLKDDAGRDGSGTDNLAAYNQLFTDALTAGATDVILPKGWHMASAPVGVSLPAGYKKLRIHGDGHMLINTSAHTEAPDNSTTPTPNQNRSWFYVRCPTNDAGYLEINGLGVTQARRSIRTGGCANVQVRGILRTRLEGLIIPRADNHGITTNPDHNTFVPELLEILRCRIGGDLVAETMVGSVTQTTVNTHGPVGDTGLWIVSPALETLLEGNWIFGTGDDMLMLGHNSTALLGGTQRRKPTVRGNTGVACANGMKILCPDVEVVGNTVDLTLNGGVYVNTDEVVQAGIGGERALIARNRFLRIGHRDNSDVNASTNVGVVNTGAIILQSSQTVVVDNYVDNTKQEGLTITDNSYGLNTTEDILIARNHFKNIGCSRDGQTLDPQNNNKPAILRKLGGSGKVVKDVYIVDNIVENSNMVPVMWNVGAALDDNIVVERTRLINVNMAGSTYALVWINATGSGRVTNFKGGSREEPAFILEGGSASGRMIRAAGGAVKREDVECWARRLDGRVYGKSVWSGIPNSRDPFLIGKRDLGTTRSEARASGDIVRFVDARRSFRIRVCTFSSATAAARGITFEAFWNAGSNEATVITHTKTSSDGKTVVPVDVANGYFFTLTRNTGDTTTYSASGVVELKMNHSATWAGTAICVVDVEEYGDTLDGSGYSIS